MCCCGAKACHSDIASYILLQFWLIWYTLPKALVDPGFPIGGGAWTPEVAKFKKFCMSKQKNLDCWGGQGHAPGMPPRSTNEKGVCHHTLYASQLVLMSLLSSLESLYVSLFPSLSYLVLSIYSLPIYLFQYINILCSTNKYLSPPQNVHQI